MIAHVVYGNFHIRKCATPLHGTCIFFIVEREGTLVIGSGREKRVIDRLNIYKDVRSRESKRARGTSCYAFTCKD